MTNTNKEKFESLWTDFVSLIKGKLISTANKQTLSTPLANLILSEAASTWLSEYEINGRWLMKFKEENAGKAGLVRVVLTHDMKFSDISLRTELPEYYNYIVPVIGAGIGYATSYFMEFGKFAQAASVIAPAILLYPAVKMFRQNQKQTIIEANIGAYIEQLNKYRDSVIAILS